MLKVAFLVWKPRHPHASADVTPVWTWPRPSNLSKVRRFLRVLSEICAKLCWIGPSSTSVHRAHNWNDELEQVFASLKRALTEAPVLCYPDSEAHFVLDTGTSADGIGAMLSQFQNREERVVPFQILQLYHLSLLLLMSACNTSTADAKSLAVYLWQTLSLWVGGRLVACRNAIMHVRV